MAEEWDSAEARFDIHDDLGMNILIRELDTSHVLTSTRAPSEGKFAFTSHNNGEHEICLSTDYLSSHRSNHGQIRMHLDIIIGDAKPNHSHKNQNHVSELSNRVKDLNALVRDIRREQRYQREREADFRNLSEKTNSRAVYWSAVQLVVLLCTCLWQLRHLRVRFSSAVLQCLCPDCSVLLCPGLFRGQEAAVIHASSRLLTGWTPLHCFARHAPHELHFLVPQARGPSGSRRPRIFHSLSVGQA